MILTLTPNPSIDRTVALDGELSRGQVHRVASVTSQAGGKGVNISRAAVSADIPSIAVVPAEKEDPFVLELLGAGIDCRPVRPARPACPGPIPPPRDESSGRAPPRPGTSRRG